MVTSPSSLNPPTNRRSISVDDYHPAPSSPQPSSSSESDNDENDPAAVPVPQPPPAKKKKKKKLRKTNSSISLDSLDRDDLADDIPANHSTQPTPPEQRLSEPQAHQLQQPRQNTQPQQPHQKSVNVSPPKKPRVEQPPHQVVKQPGNQPGNQPPKDPSQLPNSRTPVTTTPEMEPDEPMTDDNLVNIAGLLTTDDFGWDRFIFFSHRSQRHFFQENSYLSQFSPFTSVASSMSGLTTRSVCAVCGAGGTLYDCIRCPLTFHAPCIDPLKTCKFDKNWMCPACMSAKNGDTGPDWYPSPNIPMIPLPDPSTGIKRLIADVREGNPIDMVFSPNLFNYYKSIAGTDWLRCTRCRRIRAVTEGVLSEAVRIPFECALAFWVDTTDRCCDPLGEQRLYGRDEQRVVQYIRSRKMQRQLLFRFGFDEVDAVDYGKPDLQNLPKLQPLKSAQPQTKLPTVTPMEISPPTPPKAPPQQLPQQTQSAQTATQPAPTRPLPRVLIPQLKVTTPRQVAPPAAQQVQPQQVQPQQVQPQQVQPQQVQPQQVQPQQVLPQRVLPQQVQQPQQVQPQLASASATPQLSSQASARSAVPNQTPPSQTMQVSSAMLAPAAQPSNAPVAKSEPVENDQDNQDDLLAFIARLEWEQWIEDELTDLALGKDKKLTQLYTAFHAAPSKFQRQAIRLINRMMGGTRSQQTQVTTPAQPSPASQAVIPAPAQPQLQPQAPIQQQLHQQMQAQMQMAPQTTQQAARQVTQTTIQRQAPVPQRLPQSTVDVMFRQMAIKHVREMQELEQHFMRSMEQVPASRVAEVMNMKDANVAKLKNKQQQETRAFYHSHGMLG